MAQFSNSTAKGSASFEHKDKVFMRVLFLKLNRKSFGKDTPENGCRVYLKHHFNRLKESEFDNKNNFDNHRRSANGNAM